MLVWLVLSYGELFRLLARGRLFALEIGGRPFVSDFVMYYNAAVLAGRCTAGGIDIYSPEVQQRSLLELISPVVPELPFYLQYPPPFFALVRPLAYLGMTAAWAVWCALGALLVVLSAWCLARESGGLWFRRAFIVVAVLAAYPAWHGFRVGQASLFFFPLMLAYWALLRGGRPLGAGLVTGLMMVKLQYAPITLLVGCLLGRLRFAAGAALASGLLVALSVLLLGWPNVAGYPRALWQAETSGAVSGVNGEMMQDVRGALVILCGGDGPVVHLGSALALVAGLGAVAWLWLRAGKRGGCSREQFNLCASLTVLILLVTSPHTHVQDFLLSAIPCAWGYAAAERAACRSRPARLLQAMIIAMPALTWVFYLFRELFWLARLQPFFALALLMVALIWPLARDSPPPP